MLQRAFVDIVAQDDILSKVPVTLASVFGNYADDQVLMKAAISTYEMQGFFFFFRFTLKDPKMTTASM